MSYTAEVSPHPPTTTTTTSTSNDNGPPGRLANLRTRPLTPKQERRLVAYLDEQFLQLTRGFKKRTSPTTHVSTLHIYITEARKLLSFILQIPPVDPSTSLRIQYLLRLTGDVLCSIVGYGLGPSLPTSQSPPHQQQPPAQPQPPPQSPGADSTMMNVDNREPPDFRDNEEPRDYTSALRELLDWLDDLDQAWLAVLQSQVWDPDAGEGVDLILDVDVDETISSPSPASHSNGSNSTSGTAKPMSKPALKSTPISQTDTTRLRSLLVTGMASLEEWLTQTKPPSSSTTRSATSGGGAGMGEDDVAGMLERLGLLDEFDDLFSRTMDFLSGFSGGFAVEPEPMDRDDGDDELDVWDGAAAPGQGGDALDVDDEDMSDMVEVVMSGCT